MLGSRVRAPEGVRKARIERFSLFSLSVAGFHPPPTSNSLKSRSRPLRREFIPYKKSLAPFFFASERLFGLFFHSLPDIWLFRCGRIGGTKRCLRTNRTALLLIRSCSDRRVYTVHATSKRSAGRSLGAAESRSSLPNLRAPQAASRPEIYAQACPESPLNFEC